MPERLMVRAFTWVKMFRVESSIIVVLIFFLWVLAASSFSWIYWGVVSYGRSWIFGMISTIMVKFHISVVNMDYLIGIGWGLWINTRLYYNVWIYFFGIMKTDSKFLCLCLPRCERRGLWLSDNVFPWQLLPKLLRHTKITSMPTIVWLPRSHQKHVEK